MTTFNHPSLPSRFRLDLLAPFRYWLNHVEISNDKAAHLICQLIPCSCPFERTVNLFGRSYQMPALCKLNPLYNEVIYLRLRALSYLSDTCNEDITPYIC